MSELFDQARQAVQLGDKRRAMELLRSVITQDPRNDVAWELFAEVVDKREYAIDCLQRAIKINSYNASAQKKLAALQHPLPAAMAEVSQIHPASSPQASPLMAKIEAVPIPAPTTKRCLYCAEEIQAAAIVCKHCGRDQVHIPARPTFAPIPDPLPPSTPTPKAPVTPPKHAPTMTEVAPGIELRSGSYIHANLMAGERILYQTHIHWVVFLRAFVMLAFGLALLGVIALEPKNFTVCILPGLFFFVMGLVAMVVGVIQIRNIEFALTNRRVIGKRGVLHRHSLELLLTKVEAIRVDQPIAGRLFNYGTVIVTGTGGTHEPFRYIADPLEFRRQVQTQLAQIERQ